MAKTPTTFESRYRSWENKIPKQESSPIVLVKHIKEAIFDNKTSGGEEDYFRLMRFVRLASSRLQMKYVMDVAKKQGTKEIDAHIQVTNCVYGKIIEDHNLKKMMAELPEQENHSYLYVAIAKMIIKCNAEWLDGINENKDKRKDKHHSKRKKAEQQKDVDAKNDEEEEYYRPNPWTGDGGKHRYRSEEYYIYDGYSEPDRDKTDSNLDDDQDTGVLADDIEPSQFAHFDLRYIELLGEARDFAQYLLQEWDERWRNVLCEYYDYAGGKNSPRLIEESEANLHQLRKRMRDRVNELVDNNVCSFEVFDVMVKRYLKNICQKTPVLATYKRVEKNTRSED